MCYMCVHVHVHEWVVIFYFDKIRDILYFLFFHHEDRSENKCTWRGIVVVALELVLCQVHFISCMCVSVCGYIHT